MSYHLWFLTSSGSPGLLWTPWNMWHHFLSGWDGLCFDNKWIPNLNNNTYKFIFCKIYSKFSGFSRQLLSKWELRNTADILWLSHLELEASMVAIAEQRAEGLSISSSMRYWPELFTWPHLTLRRLGNMARHMVIQQTVNDLDTQASNFIFCYS